MDIGKLFGDAWGLFTKDIGPLMVGMLIAFCVPALAIGVILVATILPSFSGFTSDSSGQVTSVSGSSLALLIVGSVLAILASVLVSIPLYAGILNGVLRRVREGREMGYGDAFGGFRLFGRVVPAVLLLVVIFLAIELVPIALFVAAGVARSWIIGALAAPVMLLAIVAMIYLQISWVYLFPLIVDREGGVVAALGESRRLVHGTGWWMTFAALLVVYLAAIGASNSALPAGNISMQGVNYDVNFKGGITDPAELQNIAVAVKAGTPIYLRDIAVISDGLAPATTYSRASEGATRGRVTVATAIEPSTLYQSPSIASSDSSRIVVPPV